MHSPGQFLSHVKLPATSLGSDSPEALFAAAKADNLRQLPLPAAQGGLDFCYRGQRDASWGLTTSLFRNAPISDVARGLRLEPSLMDIEEKVLHEMRREQGLGRLMTDGELLAVLQHHGIPTRLLDVSQAPLEALFFAVDKEDVTPGRLFIIGLVPGSVQPASFTGPPADPLFWSRFRRGKTQATSDWTNMIYKIDDPSLDPRMRAQRGYFLAGGLPKRYAGKAPYQLGDHNLTLAEIHTVTNLDIAFPAPAAKKKVTARSAVAWNIEIPGTWKPTMRKLLAAEGIFEDSMYPRFDENRSLGVYMVARP